jgi:DNA repair protein RecO (recombination protein O)
VDEKTTGIILRTRPLTETSLIVHWLTPELGRIATVAKGARRPKSPFRGKLDIFYRADFSFARSRRSDLHALREASLRNTHPELRKDLGYLQQASYATSLIEMTTEAETPLPEIFALLDTLLEELPRHSPGPMAVLGFEIKLLHELGQAPNSGTAQLSPGNRHILQKVVELDWPSIFRLKPGEPQTLEMQQFLHGFLIDHLGRLPRGRSAALDVV